MMHKDKIKIAYLAPEIPALSATFVYNEILELEKKGFEIVPLSVHVPASVATGAAAARLAETTYYIYNKSVRVLFQANITMMLNFPFRYLSTLFMAMSDAVRMGLTTHIGLGLIYRFLVASHVANILLRKKCRHLHVHFAHIPADIAMYASKIPGTSFSFTSHANDLFERGWLLKEKVERAVFSVTISGHNRRFLADLGASPQKIHVVHCGIDAGAFDSRGEKPIENIPEIGTLGRMVEKKGFDVLIHACEILKKGGEQFHLTIAGDGPLREDLENLVDALGLAKEVSFPGPIPHHQVPGWLRSLDLFALPCRKDRYGDMDGIPVVLMEAMLTGVPVISTRLSGIPELVVDGETGCLADPDDPEELAESIAQLLTDRPLRTRLCRKATQKVQSEFDLSKNVEKLSELFKGAMS